MTVANRLKFTVAITSAATITPPASPNVAGYRALAQAPELPANTTGVPLICEDASNNWEESYFSVSADGLSFVRTSVAASSAGGTTPATFTGTVTVYCTPFADYVNRLVCVRDIAFAQSIPLSVPGSSYMPQQNVAGPLTLTIAAGAVRGALAWIPFIADGVNEPGVSGTLEWIGSAGYDNRNGILNILQVFCDGSQVWRSWGQAVGAVAAPAAASAVTLTGPTSGVVSTASSAFTVGVSPVGGTVTGTVVATATSSVVGDTITPSTINITNGTPSGTFTVTGSTTGVRTISITNNGGLSNPASITYTVSAAATAPGAPTIGTATAGDTTASFPFTAPGSNGGAAIDTYQLTVYNASTNAVVGTFSGTTSPINATGLTDGTSYYGKIAAHNTAGYGAQSAASNNVTPAAAAALGSNTIRLTGTKTADIVESSAAPWTYTSAIGGTGATGQMSTIALPAGTDGEVVFKVNTASNDFIVGISRSASATDTSTGVETVWAGGSAGTGVYKSLGTNQTTSTVAVATGDLIRTKITGAAAASDYLVPFAHAVSKDGGQSWLPVAQNNPGTNGLRKTPYYIRVVPGANASISVVSVTGFV